MNDIVITKLNEELVVSSRQVAKDFGKYHKDVLESIRKILTAEDSAVLKEMFYKNEYYNSQNKKQPEYLMNRDGFMQPSKALTM